MTTQHHSVNGLAFRSFSTRRSGAPAYVLVHGIGMSHRYYTRLHVALAEDAEVHAVDLPGFGGVPKPGWVPGIRETADALGHVLDELGVRDAVLVGQSMGSQWVVELAQQRPDLARGIVALGPVVDSARRRALTQALLLARDSALEPPRLNGIVVSDYLRCGPVWYARQAVHMLRYPIEDRVATLAPPLLVLRGSNDPIAAQEWAVRLAARAPDAEVAVITGHRHLAHFTAPRETAERIRAVSSRARPRSAPAADPERGTPHRDVR
ncbi:MULTISPECIES: alpha/beta fold hydrolase [Microbacterium]|uniref:alpha/beta fold hydrolase n=1 Tax=Microbacterium TaxID=33882 RepID=UPI0027D7D9E0|nr:MULTISPECIES: alpha/beta hydrolase [Microbacterium]